MAYTKEQIKDDLRALGIKEGDMVLMHASFKSLGTIEGGAKAFYEAFIELLGSEGTLLVPALSYATVTRANPVFDINEAPSCVGYLTEFFRTSVPGVVRSMHPTHSCCAVGKYAKEITEGHEKDITPVGENSPFARLPKYNGKILMLGCSAMHNTSMHGVEETAEPPYCIDRKNPIKYILKNGDTVVEHEAFPHNFRTESGAHYTQRYDKILDFLREDEKSHGYVLEAECDLMDAKAVWREGHKKLKEEPMYFVELP